MNNLQTNGEPKKIFLTKPSDYPALTYEPTTSSRQWRSLRSCSGDQVRIPPRRHNPPADKNSEEPLSNQKKQRYWNSWEELYLVELWRRYKDEVAVVNVPLPVYRKIMVAMRNRNMVVTAQDCRRKINNINTRYRQELARVESTGCKSEWRLFPLVHCVLQPKIKEYDPWQENVIIKKLLEKIPKPVEVPPPIVNNSHHNSNHNIPQAQHITSTHSQVSSYQPCNFYQTSLHAATLTSTANADASSPFNRLSTSQGRFEKPSILPFRNITFEKIEQLRQDNNRLAEQRDEDLKSLHMEEENFRCFEAFIRTWTEQKEMELRRVQLLPVQSVISIENEENQNVEQQLQETVIAK